MTSITAWIICGGSMVSAWAVLAVLRLEAGRHGFNGGITFKMTLTPVPEMEAIYPIISLWALIAFAHILRQWTIDQLRVGA